MTAVMKAVQCPVVQVPAAMLKLSLAESTPGGNAPCARSFSAGDTSTVPGKLNRNATQLDLAGRYGGGGYAVAWGLVLTKPVSGLLLQISAGHALIDGVVERATDSTLAVPDTHPGPTDRVWVWLTQAGALSAVANSLTPPAGACCLLGSCTTSGGNITAVDTSGVLYARGGTLWRETADGGMPADTPPAGAQYLCSTPGGLWWWDGTHYRHLSPGAVETVRDGVVIGVPADYQMMVMDSLGVYGTFSVYGKVRVL